MILELEKEKDTQSSAQIEGMDLEAWTLHLSQQYESGIYVYKWILQR